MINNQMLESNYLALLIRTLLSQRFFSKIANGTVCLFSNWIGKIVRCHSEIIAMIINRKSKGKFIKSKKIKCRCPECRNRIEQRNRFISTDFLASMAYNHRVCRSERQSIKPDQNPSRNCAVNPSSSSVGRNSGSNMIDVKSVQQRISRREASRNIGKDWWSIMKENNDRMPPIKNTNIQQISTRSECSSQFSGFRSTPETNLTQCQSDILTSVSTDGEEDVSITDRSTSYKNRLSKSEPRNLSGIRCSRDKGLPQIRIFSTRTKRTHGNFSSMMCTKRHRDRRTIKNYLKPSCKSF